MHPGSVVRYKDGMRGLDYYGGSGGIPSLQEILYTQA